MTPVLITIAIIFAVFVLLIGAGFRLRRIRRAALQKEMSTWLMGDLIQINPKSQIWKDIVSTHPYHSTVPSVILVRWSPFFIEIQTIRGKNYFIGIDNVSENTSATERRLTAEMEAYQKNEEERTYLNPDTVYNNISIYTMNRSQLDEALAAAEREQKFELCGKIKNIIEDKYAE